MDRELLERLARESGRTLGELGVRPEDRDWIGAHAETIASLAGGGRRSGREFLGLLGGAFYRLARRAARRAR
jgi:hypothetical protein